MKLLDSVTHVHGWLSDKDFIWWPFSFLRPDPKTAISFKLICLMTMCFAGLSYVMYVVYAVANNALVPDDLIRYFFMFFGGFFVWFNIVTRPLWNRRARLLNK